MSDTQTEWTLVEVKRRWIPEWVFGLLCCVGPRRWMLWQPFRSILFERVSGDKPKVEPHV